MDDLLIRFNQEHLRYLLIGGQAVRLEGMPRFSMDWDFYVPPHDDANFRLLNRILEPEVDVPIIPLGPKGENVVQTYQTRWGIIQFHLGGPGLPPFDEAETRRVLHRTETGVDVQCLSGSDLLESKRRANRPQDQDDILFLSRKAAAGLL